MGTIIHTYAAEQGTYCSQLCGSLDALIKIYKMVSEGVQLLVVKEVLDHSMIKMNELYAHLAPHRARDAVNQLRNRSVQSAPAEVVEHSQTHF